MPRCVVIFKISVSLALARASTHVLCVVLEKYSKLPPHTGTRVYPGFQFLSQKFNHKGMDDFHLHQSKANLKRRKIKSVFFLTIVAKTTTYEKVIIKGITLRPREPRCQQSLSQLKGMWHNVSKNQEAQSNYRIALNGW